MAKINAQLIAFDLDGTLALSKEAIETATAKMLLSLLEKRKQIAIVTGGKYELIETQVLHPLVKQCEKVFPKTPAGKKKFEKVFANLKLLAVSGTQAYAFENGTIKKMWDEKMTATERIEAASALAETAGTLGFLNAKKVFGNRIEDRGGQVSFSALGQEAPISKKQAWDPTGEKRKRLAKETQKVIPNLEVRPGGASTVDVTKIGSNKGVKLKMLAATSGIPLSKIFYFGDKFDGNGNDQPVADAGIAHSEVKNPADTLKQVKALFL